MHLLAQEDASCDCRGGDSFVIQVGQQEVCLTDFIAIPLGRDEARDGFGPRTVLAELLTQKLGQQLAIDWSI